MEETVQPFVPSGHAFVTFDSSAAADACIKKFQIGASGYMRYFYQKMKDKLCSCFGEQSQSQRSKRATSTFIKFNDLDEVGLKEKYEEAVLEVRKAIEPNDILWKNMKGEQGHFIFRRLLIYIACLVLIVFVSTPIVIFANVKKTNADLFNLKFAENMYGGSFIETNFPPLCVITINIALLYLIDFAALYEYHETHSLYQKSVLTKTLIYLTLNMIMIPALTLSNTSIELDKKMTVNTQVETANSLWQFFKMKNFNFTEILGEIYVGDNGLFFVSLVFMQAAVSFSYYLL